MRATLLFAMVALALQASAAGGRLIYGSFSDRANAERWAGVVRDSEIGIAVEVLTTTIDGRVTHRVASQLLSAGELDAAREHALDAGLSVWRMRLDENADHRSRDASPASVTESKAADPLAADERVVPRQSAPPADARRPIVDADYPPPIVDADYDLDSQQPPSGGGRSEIDFDFGLQTRTFSQTGAQGQGRFQPSLSAQLSYYHEWADERTSFRLTPFARYDVHDDNRTHVDLRDAYLTRVGDRWDLHAGVRRVFWGVAEFKHLVDIVNQTDFVENIDGEDKLGQPMVNLSLVRQWGILDLFLLVGFRERTFPSLDGRLGPSLEIADPIYESDRGASGVDGAIRWSHGIGPLEFGLSHFSGTGREPVMVPRQIADEEWELQPLYPLIEQTSADAQAIFGDWALKLEALSRAGQGPRFSAATVGFERTLVGAFGTRADLGVVVEYMWDERGDLATTLLQDDVAIGARWLANDLWDTQALFGVILDVANDEYIVQLEASRRLSEVWSMNIEARLFGGGEPFSATPPAMTFDGAASWNPLAGSLQRDDVLQLDFIRFF